MTKTLWRLGVLALVAATVPAAAQTSATRSHVQTLASDKFAGREAGSTGERLAADYIASQLSRLGAKPLPGRGDVEHGVLLVHRHHDPADAFDDEHVAVARDRVHRSLDRLPIEFHAQSLRRDGRGQRLDEALRGGDIQRVR